MSDDQRLHTARESIFLIGEGDRAAARTLLVDLDQEDLKAVRQDCRKLANVCTDLMELKGEES